MLNFEEDFTPAAKPMDVPSFLSKESAPVGKGSLFLTRPNLVHYIADRASLEARAGDVFGAAAAGRLRVRIHRTYPLAEAAEAHRALEGRETAGKVLLHP